MLSRQPSFIEVSGNWYMCVLVLVVVCKIAGGFGVWQAGGAAACRGSAGGRCELRSACQHSRAASNLIRRTPDSATRGHHHTHLNSHVTGTQREVRPFCQPNWSPADAAYCL